MSTTIYDEVEQNQTTLNDVDTLTTSIDQMHVDAEGDMPRALIIINVADNVFEDDGIKVDHRFHLRK